jgi:hypothetical protein
MWPKPVSSPEGRAILLEACFQPASSALMTVGRGSKSRLKGGCSHDWLPHDNELSATIH